MFCAIKTKKIAKRKKFVNFTFRNSADDVALLSYFFNSLRLIYESSLAIAIVCEVITRTKLRFLLHVVLFMITLLLKG